MALIAGIKHIRDGIEPQAVIGVDLGIIGLIGTAPAADAEKFPLNTAVYVRTDNLELRTALGATGTIPDAMIGISAQLAGDIGAAEVVVVRVEDDEDAQEVIANIIGSEGSASGLWAFLNAPYELGITPRLIIAPGYTAQSVQGIKKGAITPGSGGANGTFNLAFTGGTGTGAAGTFTVTGGAVTAVTITNPGAYTVAPTASFAASTGLTGAGVVLTLEQLANGVCAAIPTILERLNAHFLPEGPTASRQAFIDWLETVPPSARILHPLRQAAKVLDSEGDVVEKPLSPYIIAKYTVRDAEFDGIPGHSIANQAIYGLVGVAPSIPFSITDENSIGQSDIALHAGIVVRGDIGVDGSLTDGGFVFWGTDTMSAASEWMFANVTRMRDYIEIMQVKVLRYYLGRYNLTMQVVDAVINTLESQLVQWLAKDAILGFRISYDKNVNTPEELRLGNIDLTVQVEEPPVLRKITIRSRRYRQALVNLSQSIAQLLGG